MCLKSCARKIVSHRSKCETCDGYQTGCQSLETGETQPNTDTLKLLSQEFEVSVNTLLGSPRQLICQCCGMPLNEDAFISREKDGSYNEDYCKWCYAEGSLYISQESSLLDYLVETYAES